MLLLSFRRLDTPMILAYRSMIDLISMTRLIAITVSPMVVRGPIAWCFISKEEPRIARMRAKKM